MKALTLTQPYATLMATLRPSGLAWKEIETRGWRTSYRGELVIHAAKGFPVWAQETCEEPEFAHALGGLSPAQLPRSVGLCVVQLIACIRMEDHIGTGPGFSQHTLRKCAFALGHEVQPSELEFGDWSPGRWAWVTKYVRPLPNVGPVRGALSLWDWPKE